MTCSTTEAFNLLKDNLKKLSKTLFGLSSDEKTNYLKDENNKSFDKTLKSLETHLDNYSDSIYDTNLRAANAASATNADPRNDKELARARANEAYPIQVYTFIDECKKIDGLKLKKRYLTYIINSITYVLLLKEIKECESNRNGNGNGNGDNGETLAKTMLRYNYIKFIKFNKEKNNIKEDSSFPFSLKIWGDVKNGFEENYETFKPLNDAITAYEKGLITDMN
jgi:hypothetical protein